MLKRYPLFLLAATALMLGSCGKKQTPEELALAAAKSYYDQLLQGDYGAFVSATYGYDSISAGYREELETNMKMYLHQQKKANGGIDSVTTSKVKVDTVKIGGSDVRIADAFLIMHFGNSRQEEVLIPMIERDGHWIMK